MSRAYRHRVKIITDRTDDGNPDPKYIDKMTGIPCQIIPKTAFESQRGQQLEATVSHVIELRWYDGFLPDDIFVNEEISGETYLIKGIIDVDGYKRQMRVFCTEVQR